MPKTKKKPEGCDSRTCPDLHPTVCFGSLNNKQCNKPKCTLYHLRGTKKFSSNDNPSKEMRVLKNQNSISQEKLTDADGFLEIRKATSALLETVNQLATRLLALEGRDQTKGALYLMPTQTQMFSQLPHHMAR